MNRIITFSLFSVSLIAPIIFLYSSFVVSPLEYFIHYTGHSALVALALVLLCSRLNMLNKYLDRKYIGLIAFIFISIHVLVYFYELDFDIKYLILEATSLLYLTIGYIAYILFLPLVFTSNEASKVYLKSYWFLLHKLVYIIIILSLFHYYFIIKVDAIWLWLYIITFTILFMSVKKYKK